MAAKGEPMNTPPKSQMTASTATAQRPSNFGARFSKKAWKPSRVSRLARFTAWEVTSTSIASSKLRKDASESMRLESDSAIGGPAAKPLTSDARVDVQQERHVRIQPTRRELVHLPKQLHWEVAPAALVGDRRVRESIAKDRLSRLERW